MNQTSSTSDSPPPSQSSTSGYSDRVGGSLPPLFSRLRKSHSKTTTKRRKWRWVARLLGVLCWIPAIALAWTQRPYLLDLVAQLAIPLIVVQLIFATYLLVRKRRRVLTVVVMAIVAQLTLTIMDYTAGPLATAPLKGPTESLKLVQYNAGSYRSESDSAFIDWLLNQNADLVSIVDPKPGFPNHDQRVLDAYPYRIFPIPGMDWPIVLLSKHPFESAELAPFDESVKFSFIAHRSLLVTLPTGSRMVFSAMYPRSPRTYEFWSASLDVIRRDAGIIRRWKQTKRDNEPPFVLAGDFNSTPTGRTHRLMRAISKLRPLSTPFGAGTWPSSWPSLLSLPIDRVWVNDKARVKSWHVGPHFASDHRPLVVELEIAK